MANPLEQSLNQYNGTDELGAALSIVAPDMATACEVYAKEKSADPVIMQCIKKAIKCVLPDTFVSFKTEVANAAAKVAGCMATPDAYTLTAGTKQVFTALPKPGWAFEKWSIDGADVVGDEGTKATALLTIPSSATVVTVTATFKPVV